MPDTHTHPGADRCPGTTRAHPGLDGLVARVRLAGAPMTVPAALGVAGLSDSLGDGSVWLTSRANVQVRGLTDVEAFAAGIAALGLMPSHTHDRARNVVVSPCASAELLALAAHLDASICARPELAAASGRFLVGLDDGSGHLLALPLDIAAQVHAGRVRLGLGRDPRSYDAGPVSDPAAVAATLLDVWEQFVTLARADTRGEDVWNVADLADPEELHGAVEEMLPPAGALHVARRQPRLAGPLPGGWLGATMPLATIPTAGWRALAHAAQRAGSGIQVTPWHAVVLRCPRERQAPLCQDLSAAGWVVDPTSPWLDVHGCPGDAHCRKALGDVHAHTRALVESAERGGSERGEHERGTHDMGPVMVAGCERRCGHPSVPHVAAVATGPQSYAVAEHDGTHDPQPPPVAYATPATLAQVVAARREGRA